MPEYQWAEANGNIVVADYDRSMALSNEQVKNELKIAFESLGNSIELEPISDELCEVYKITVPYLQSENTVYVCAKGTTPGGRNNLMDEQRIQQKAKYLNFAYDKLEMGEKAISLGVYKRGEEVVYCAWRLTHSNAASGDTPISKQIKINTIAKALTEGFVQQDKGHGEFACAFRKEFIYFYLNNSDWIHTGNVSELAEHTIPEQDNSSNEDNEFVNIDELMQLDNQKFAFACIDLMKEHKLLTADNLSLLADKDKCASMFKHNNFCGIFFKLDSDTDENEQKNGQDGRLRYYADNYDIDGAKYAVSAQWRPMADNADSRTPFINWIIEQLQKVKYETGYKNDFARNRILFGAPGTGKSYTINKEREELLGKDNELDYERVTFHPDYSYANFVGTYKPVPCKDSDGKDAITYEYVPGPFMRVFVKALKNGRTNNAKPYLLIIEEINRANVAAVFGDVFQLLDRDKNEVSEYSIQASEDIKKFLAKPENLGGNPEDYQKIRIPDNMFIWATMNSADQGVFPMDTAFKRRWDFKYLGIDESDAEVQGKMVVLGTKSSHRVEWNKLRKSINKFLATQKINEDKQLGPYFIAKRIVVPENGNEIDSKKFIETFKNKVIMYLFEDAAKQKRATLFEGCFKNSSRYSEICKEFEEKGIVIFNSEIQLATEPEDLPNTEATNESTTEDTNE